MVHAVAPALRVVRFLEKSCYGLFQAPCSRGCSTLRPPGAGRASNVRAPRELPFEKEEHAVGLPRLTSLGTAAVVGPAAAFVSAMVISYALTFWQHSTNLKKSKSRG